MLNIIVPALTKKAHNKLILSKENWEKGIVKGAKLAGRAIQKRATTMLLTGVRSGRKYSRLPNISSAPGEYPRSQSGRLVRSIYYKAGSKFEFRVGATEPHAEYLEDGTPNITARPTRELPWLQLAMSLEERTIENYLTDGVIKELK